MAFTCKRFVIEDSQCAMKVGTDSLMLGSWAKVDEAKRILDIGTGCGLLALMLAQRAEPLCLIEGIDIDADAIKQATQNALSSPWAKQLKFHHCSLQQHQVGAEYDVIISNPPYFSENLTANKAGSPVKRQVARQTLSLDHHTLLTYVTNHLSRHGHFYCVLPANIAKAFCQIAQSLGLYCIRCLEVSAKPNAPVSRVLMSFSPNFASTVTEHLCIHTTTGNYSQAYRKLCQAYYLKF